MTCDNSTGSMSGSMGTKEVAADVKAMELAALKKVRDVVYQHRTQYANSVDLPTNEPADRVQLFGTNYRAATTTGEQTYPLNQDDLRNILRSIRNGKQYANFAIATIHTHQGTSFCSGSTWATTRRIFWSRSRMPRLTMVLTHSSDTVCTCCEVLKSAKENGFSTLLVSSSERWTGRLRISAGIAASAPIRLSRIKRTRRSRSRAGAARSCVKR